MTLVQPILKALAAAVAFAVYVWFTAVRVTPSVKRRKAAKRARRRLVNRILMCRKRGAGEPGSSCAILVAAVLACALARRRHPDGRRLERRPLRDPGRRLARPRARHARRPARPARSGSASTSSASTCTGIGSRLSAASRPGRTATPCSRACERGASPPSSASSGRRAGRTGAGRRTSRPARPAFAAFARDAATRYRWVKQWLVWNEPNQARWLRPTTAGGLRAPAPQPRLCRDSRSDSRRQGGGRRHRPACLDRRRLTGQLDPRHAERRSPARRLRAPSVSVEHPRDALHRWLRALHDDHDGDARAAPLRGRPRIRAEADLADRVRLPDGTLRRQPAAAGRADRPVRRCACTRRPASTC